jgi:predicted membrane channel-forming protein YqfA (hemolysin III family)
MTRAIAWILGLFGFSIAIFALNREYLLAGLAFVCMAILVEILDKEID